MGMANRSTVHGIRRACWTGGALGALAAIVLLLQPNTYKAECRILPVEAKGNASLGGVLTAAAAMGIGLPGKDSSEGTYLDIINSRWMSQALLQKEFEFSMKSWLWAAPRLRRMTLLQYLKARNLDEGVQAMPSVLTASRDAKSGLLKMTVETKAPELSQQVNQEAVKLLEAFLATKSRTHGGDKARFAEERLKEGRVSLAQAEEALRAFWSSNINWQTSPDPTVRLKGARLDAELRLDQQITSTLALNREQALLEEKNDLPILNVLDPPNLPIKKSGPRRSLYVAGAAMLGFLAVLGGENRARIKGFLVFPS